MLQNLSVTIVGLDKFIEDVGKAGGNIKPLLGAVLQNSATEVQRNVRSRAAHKTGSLQRSILTQVNYPTATVTVDEPYGIYVENGTAPHIILPKNKKALFWPGAASPYKVVHHPGTRAQPFFKPGVEASQGYIQTQMDKMAQKIIDFMKGTA